MSGTFFSPRLVRWSWRFVAKDLLLNPDWFFIEMQGVTVFWPLVVMLGLCAGTLTGLFGVGGGFLLTPCLNIFFGISWGVAIGSGLVQFFFTSANSAWKHYRKENVDLKLGVLMAMGAVSGSILGKRCFEFLKANVGTFELMGHTHQTFGVIMKTLFVGLMGFVMVSILRETASKKDEPDPEPAMPAGDCDSSEDPGPEMVPPARPEQVSTQATRFLHALELPPMLSFPRSHIPTLSLWVPLTVSFCVGIMTGLLGVGGGFILFPLLVYIIGVPITVAVGTSSFQIVFATAMGGYIYYSDNLVSWPLVGSLLSGALLGVQIGVWLSNRIGGKSIRKYFAYVLLLGVIVVFGSLVRNLIYGDTRAAPAPVAPAEKLLDAS